MHVPLWYPWVAGEGGGGAWNKPSGDGKGGMAWGAQLGKFECRAVPMQQQGGYHHSGERAGATQRKFERQELQAVRWAMKAASR